MKPNISTRTLLILLSLVIGLMIAVPTLAATLTGAYSLDWFSFNNGGGSSIGGAYTLNSSIGQVLAGSLSGGAYRLNAGYWPEITEATTVSPTLDLAKSVSSPIAAPGQTLTFTLSLTAAGPAAIPAILTDTLPISMTYVNGSATGGATYDAATRQIRLNGSIVPSAPTIITYRATVDLGVPPGSLLANEALVSYVVDHVVYRIQRTAAIAVPNTLAFPTLVLIYANGDNNLSTNMLDLLNSAEKSAGNPNSVILLLLDGPADDDTRLYRLRGDVDGSCPNYQNPTCNGRYVLGQNMWEWSDDTANAYSLSEFLKSAIRAYPGAGQVVVSLVGHGSGWYPNVLLGQPSAWDGQPGGLLWDAHPGGYLTTRSLGDAFRWAVQATGRKINLLYLDACLMSMSEVAYEVSDSVDLVLASENWSWASFPYDAYLGSGVLDGLHTPAQIGANWLGIQANLLRSNAYPFTLALIDSSRMSTVRSSVEALASALAATLPADRGKLAAAHVPAICFDSNQDGSINAQDNTCDLAGFARRLVSAYSGNPIVISAANAVQTAVAAAVLLEDHQNGVPYKFPNSHWEWESLGGLSVYAPFRVDDWKRAYYSGSHLRFAQNGQWGALLNAFWNAAPPLPPCTGECPPPPPPIDPAPISAQVSAGHENILLTWSLDEPVSNLIGYHVLRQISGTAAITLTTTPLNANQYIDASGLITGTTYCYQVKGVNNSGAVVAQSGIDCVKFGKLTLWTPHVFAPANAANVLVPVNVSQADGLCMAALQVTVSYSRSIVTASGLVSPTIFTPGYSYAANTSTPGKVTIAAINSTCTPLHGPGTLFNLGFNVIGAQGQSSPINFITGITYTVIYDDDDLLHPVPLSLESGSLTVGNNYMRGDVNGESHVNVADALLALRISVGQITPTPQQQGACDVNGDVACSAADATLILCYSAGGTWSGCGAAALALDSHIQRQTPDVAIRQEQNTGVSAQSNIVRLGLGTTTAGQAMTTTVTIANGREFAGGTFTFQYDPNRLTFSAASLAALTGGYNVQSYVLQPGLVRVALARRTAINADGAILNLRFAVTASLPEASSLREGISLSSVRLNDAAGRDFATSALQKQIEIVSLYRVYLPLVIR
jgi:uncharacterized repeat protein (TIGR01451 family)